MATTTMATVKLADLPLPFTDGGMFTRRVLVDAHVEEYVAAFGQLPAKDQTGFALGYFVGGPVLTYDGDDNLCVDVDAGTGEVYLRELLTDCLCAGCASEALDFAYYVAYQSQGELSSGDEVCCDECGRVIFAPRLGL